MTVMDPPLRIAYQGEPGAYSEQASRDYFDLYLRDARSASSMTSSANAQPQQPLLPQQQSQRQEQAHQPHPSDTASTPPHHYTSAEFVPCANFRDLFQAVSDGHADRAVVPFENSLAGTLHQNLDTLLRHPDLHIVGEHDFRVEHCLVATPGVTLADVRVVRSHYMALAQCNEFLAKHKLVPEVAEDTAGSAKRIRKEHSTDTAAIAGRHAAQLYGLQILAENIEDEPENFTRFLILSKSPNGYRADLPAKTSIVFTLADQPAALFRALSVFAVLDANLSKVESRHIHTVRDALGAQEDMNVARCWNYVFYLDFDRSYAEQAVRNALENLKLITPFFRVLGSYRRHVHS